MIFRESILDKKTLPGVSANGYVVKILPRIFKVCPPLKAVMSRNKNAKKSPVFWRFPFSYIRGRCAKKFNMIGWCQLRKKWCYARSVRSFFFHLILWFCTYANKKMLWAINIGGYEYFFLPMWRGRFREFSWVITKKSMQQIKK